MSNLTVDKTQIVCYNISTVKKTKGFDVMRVWTFDEIMADYVRDIVRVEQVGNKFYLGVDAPEDVIKAFLITVIQYSIDLSYDIIIEKVLDSYINYIHDRIYENWKNNIPSLHNWCIAQNVENLIDMLDLGTY